MLDSAIKAVIMVSFVERFKKIHKTLKHNFFRTLFLKFDQKGILHFLNAISVYLQGALRQKQWIYSFLEHFKGNHENI